MANAEIVAIGSELLLGQIVDTNSAWLGEQLAANGIDSLVQVKIGDKLPDPDKVRYLCELTDDGLLFRPAPAQHQRRAPHWTR